MKIVELVFIPTPGMGHLVSTVETAKLLVNIDSRVSVTVLIIQPPIASSNVSSYIQSLDDGDDRIRFIELPKPRDDLIKDVPPHKVFLTYIEGHKDQVKEAVMTMSRGRGSRGGGSSSNNSVVVGGFVVDMFCTSMIDVANEIGIPTYAFVTTGAAFSSLMFYIQVLVDEQNVDICEYKDSDKELLCPGFSSPLPANVLPSIFLEKEWSPIALDIARRIKLETKGIMVNSFLELETSSFHSLSNYYNNNTPLVYPVGPVLNLKGGDDDDADDDKNSSESDIMSWLNAQPASSVVFLCFGSMGSFNPDQVNEIARALEQSGHRFLWSLRKPQPKGEPSEYSNFEQVLPEGFLDRTAGKGKVIGWAPQVRVLAHPAVGGFVSHCGWNSTLESVWFGVPIAAWPMYAEQQLNAFQLVKELGLAVEIKMDYRREPRMGIEEQIVTVEEIKKGIMELMNEKSQVRERMKKMSGQSRVASVNGGGSSFSSLRGFIDQVVGRINMS